MYIFWFALWVVLNGRWTTEIAVFGLVFAAIMFLFSTFFLGFGPKREARLLQHGWHALLYGVLLVREIVKANLTVMRMILTPGFEPHPKLVRFSSGLRHLRHRVALADSITLTPGTITCMLNGDHFMVHCLDASLTEGLADGSFVQALHALGTEQPETAEPEEEAEPANEAPAETAETGEIPSEEAVSRTEAAEEIVEAAQPEEAAREADPSEPAQASAEADAETGKEGT